MQYTSYFTKAFASLPPDQADQLSKQAVASISQSFTGAAQVAKQFPQAQAQDIINAAKQAFLDGKTAALIFATVAAGVGFLVVFFFYPRREAEDATYARVRGQIAAGRGYRLRTHMQMCTPCRCPRRCSNDMLTVRDRKRDPSRWIARHEEEDRG